MTTANHAGVKCLAAAMRQTMRPKKKKLDCVPNAVWPRLPLFSREKQRLRSLSCCALPTGRHRGTMQQTILWSVVGSDQGPRSGGGRGLARPSVLECGWTYHHHSPGVVPFIRETKIHAEENRRVTGRTNASVPSHQPSCHPSARATHSEFTSRAPAQPIPARRSLSFPFWAAPPVSNLWWPPRRRRCVELLHLNRLGTLGLRGNVSDC